MSDQAEEEQTTAEQTEVKVELETEKIAALSEEQNEETTLATE